MTGPEVAMRLRGLVAAFNRQPMSLSSVDALREGVLRAADVLDNPHLDIGAALAELHSVRADRLTIVESEPEPRRSRR